MDSFRHFSGRCGGGLANHVCDARSYVLQPRRRIYRLEKSIGIYNGVRKINAAAFSVLFSPHLSRSIFSGRGYLPRHGRLEIYLPRKRLSLEPRHLYCLSGKLIALLDQSLLRLPRIPSLRGTWTDPRGRPIKRGSIKSPTHRR